MIGFVIFSVLIICFMKEGFTLYQKGDDDFSKGLGLGLFICMFVLLVNNTVGDRWSYFELSGYLWVFAGLVARLNAISRVNSLPQFASKTAPAPTQDLIPQKKTRKSYYK